MQDAQTNIPNKPLGKKNKKSRKLFWLLFLLSYVVVGFGSWKGNDYYRKHYSVGPMAEMGAEEIKEVVSKIKDLMILPDNEVPQVVKLSNVAELVKVQPFFIGSKNGDIFLAYNQSRKAIVYRPSENKIVNVGPITFADDQSQKEVTEKPGEKKTKPTE